MLQLFHLQWNYFWTELWSATARALVFSRSDPSELNWSLVCPRWAASLWTHMLFTNSLCSAERLFSKVKHFFGL